MKRHTGFIGKNPKYKELVGAGLRSVFATTLALFFVALVKTILLGVG